ncbi:MAG: RnfABCDGE type electron transport complex subunit D [bacterium]
MEGELLLTLSSSPHVRDNISINKIMYNVVLALMPTVIMGIVYFGAYFIRLMIFSILSAVISEAAIQYVLRKKITIGDGSAVLTGLLLGLTIPPQSPWWLPTIGSSLAIILGKQIYGGLGHNCFNPALVGRTILMVSWPVQMTTWMKPSPFSFKLVDAISTATPLSILKGEGALALKNLNQIDSFGSFWRAIVGIGKCSGQIPVIPLVLGGLYLLVKGYITWHIPASYIGSMAVFTGIFWLVDPTKYANPLFHLSSGGLMIGSLFMATDYVTSPMKPEGMLIFGVGCGILTGVIRLLGGYPEGVSFAILIMNAFTPLIDKYTQKRKKLDKSKCVKH